MHEVPPDHHDIDTIGHGGDHRHEQECEIETMASCSPPDLSAHGGAAKDEERYPDPSGAEGVEEVAQALCRPGGEGGLGQGGVGEEHPEIGGSQQLKEHRRDKEGAGGEEPAVLGARGRGHQDHESSGEGDGHQAEVGPNEGPEAGQEGEYGGASSGLEAADQEPPQQPDPPECEAGLEARGGEVPHRVHAYQAEHSCRNDHRRPSPTSESSRSDTREPYPQRGCSQAEEHRPPGRGQQTEGAAHEGQDPDPDGVGDHFDPFAHVVDGPVAGEDVPDHPEVDVGIVRDPSMGPPANGDDGDGQTDQAKLDPGPRRGTAISGSSIAHAIDWSPVAFAEGSRATGTTCGPARADGRPWPTSACERARGWSQAVR